jgi:hypothetical protein
MDRDIIVIWNGGVGVRKIYTGIPLKVSEKMGRIW